MGSVTITPTEVLTVIAGAAGLVSAVWHAAMYVGRLSVRVTLHDGKLKEHEDRLDDHDRELRFVKGIR